MSIASEITRITSNIAAAYTECEAKDATMPLVRNSANLAECIASITGGLAHLVAGEELIFYMGSSVSGDTITISNSTVSGETIDIG